MHIAAWAICYDEVDLRGTTGKYHQSPLISYLEGLGFQSIDVQYGVGFLNYINGYTSKSMDALDFRMTEHVDMDQEPIAGASPIGCFASNLRVSQKSSLISPG